jgi:hypothetical protein
MATGYGTDTWCGGGLLTGRTARGVMSVALALYRRLITPRGTLRGVADEDDELNYGFDMASYVGKVGYEVSINALPGLVRGELMKDDRVLDVVATVTPVDNGDGTIDLLVEVDVVLQDEGDEFAMTMSVDDAGTELLRVSEAA